MFRYYISVVLFVVVVVYYLFDMFLQPSQLARQLRPPVLVRRPWSRVHQRQSRANEVLFPLAQSAVTSGQDVAGE